MTSPLTPPDLDLRDFPYLPLDIARLFGSQFHAIASDAEWRAGMILWLKSYHQVPAASLPDDDVALARLAEFGRDVRGWKKVRDVALRGWVLCDDGRLYHPVVAEKALVALLGMLGKRRFSDIGNAKRWKVAFDSTEIDNRIATAAGLLSNFNPKSSALNKKFVVEAIRNPGGTKIDPAGTPAGKVESAPDGSPQGNAGRNPARSAVGTPADDPAAILRKDVEDVEDVERKNIARGAPAERGAPEAVSKPRRKKPPMLPMPARESGEFAALREAFFAYGRSKHMPEPLLADEFDGFVGHHQAKGSVFADWIAAGQNWLRRTRQFNQPRGGAQQGRPQI